MPNAILGFACLVPGFVVSIGCTWNTEPEPYREKLATDDGEDPFVDKPTPPPRELVHRPARNAVLLALAHRIIKSSDNDEYRDLADAAQQLEYSRTRISLIVKLLVLAPDIQEEILFFERIDGFEPK